MTVNDPKTAESLRDADLDGADGGLIVNLSVGLKAPPAGQAGQPLSDPAQKLQYVMQLDR